MAHFARIDENNIVDLVITVDNKNLLNNDGVEDENVGIVFLKGLYVEDYTWVQTSYNNNMRKNYAGMGYTYDESRDAFIEPKPYDSWVLNEETCKYDPPISAPLDGKMYDWNEDTTSWDEVDMGDE